MEFASRFGVLLVPLVRLTVRAVIVFSPEEDVPSKIDAIVWRD
jgi:hypothetical protein